MDCMPVFSLEPIKFVDNGYTYIFSPKKCLNPSGREKKIFLGCFEYAHNPNCIALPNGLEFEKEYCLKSVSLFFPLQEHLFPPERHFWDFFPFEGENLREALALNDDAKKLSNLLAETTSEKFNEASRNLGVLDCAIIEPVYLPFNIADFKSPIEKIDCMIQIVSGLKQLFSHTVLENHKIVAHRDVKFANVVVQNLSDGSKRLRLIDFPSVKTQNIDKSSKANHTQIGFFSFSNTAPEDVMRRFSISEKTDVFALGTMLAEIFKIWDFNEIQNPLTLLFDCTKGINITEPNECRVFYSTLNEKYQYINQNVPGWLEQTLDAHNKNACWNEIERICPEVRTLFRAATAIDPKNRITLNNFDKELRSIRHNLSLGCSNTSPQAKEVLDVPKKISYLLVDTLDLNLHCDTYIDAICQVAQISPDTDFAVMPFGWRHMTDTMSSCPESLNMNPLNVDDACDYIRNLDSTSREGSFASEIKGCLFEISEYLNNQSNLNNFSREIHIFSPEMPHKKNSCVFQDYVVDELGMSKVVHPTNAQVCQKFDKDVKIYVHAYKTPGELEDADWYTPVYLKLENKTMVYGNEHPSSPTNEDKPTPQNEPSDVAATLTKGIGFRFVGGVLVFLNDI